MNRVTQKTIKEIVDNPPEWVHKIESDELKSADDKFNISIYFYREDINDEDIAKLKALKDADDFFGSVRLMIIV